MTMKYTWKIGGEAGFGILTTGSLFSKIASRRGSYIFDFIEYPSLIRGGHNTYDVTISDTPVHSLKEGVDVLICLNKETYVLHKSKLSSTSRVVYDPDEFTPEEGVIRVAVPFTKILAELKGQVIMKNTIALGASLAIFGADLTELLSIFETQFKKKGAEVISMNQEFAKRGFDMVIQNNIKDIIPALQKKESGKKIVLNGNEAFSYGAVAADCRFYCAYPMTPASTVLTTLAAWGKKTGMVVRHAEDEISVINTALGASFAGVRSAVGSSGGGFALMVEAISLSGITEIPLVIFLSQRPGPATGMPTWTEQADLLFAVHAGHGEFQKIVLAPGDQEEMILQTIKAFDLADVYQVPVIVMSDMLLSEAHKSISFEKIADFLKTYKPNRGKLVATAEHGYKRFAVTDDGISPRLIPGDPNNFYQANSYEHLEDGHTTESDIERIKQVNKRARKMNGYLTSDFILPTVLGDLKQAKTVFIGWGSTKGVFLDAEETAKEKGLSVAFMHFSHVYPLSKEKLSPLFADTTKKYILVENNSEGQFGKLLRMETGISIEKKVLRYDGRPLTVEAILAEA